MRPLRRSVVCAHIPRTISIFVIAAFIAFGVQPIAARLERRMPKPLAISIVFFGLLLLVAIFLVIVVPLTISQTQLLAANIPALCDHGARLARAASKRRSKQHFPTLKLPASDFNFGKIGGAQISGFVSARVASLGAIARQHRDRVLHRVLGDHPLVLLPAQRYADRRGFASMFPPRRDRRRASSPPR